MSNSDYVAIGQWFLNTVNDDNTTNHDQYTRYTYTPASSITANVLRVAGGGGGGSHVVLVVVLVVCYIPRTFRYRVQNRLLLVMVVEVKMVTTVYTNGYDTTFSGLTTSVGGGRGGCSDWSAGTVVRVVVVVQHVQRGDRYVSGQGNAGGNGNSGDNYNGGGGGGAGGVGAIWSVLVVSV